MNKPVLVVEHGPLEQTIGVVILPPLNEVVQQDPIVQAALLPDQRGERMIDWDVTNGSNFCNASCCIWLPIPERKVLEGKGD